MNRYSTLSAKEAIGQGRHCIVDGRTSEVIAVAYERSDAMKIVQALNREPYNDAQSARHIAYLERVFNTRVWSHPMLDAWHKNVPDIEKAFAALRIAVANEEAKDAQSPQG